MRATICAGARTVHFTDRGSRIVRVEHTDEPVPLCLLRDTITHDLGLGEGLVATESLRQDLIGALVADVTNEQAEVVLRPLRKRLVLPHLASGATHEL